MVKKVQFWEEIWIWIWRVKWTKLVRGGQKNWIWVLKGWKWKKNWEIKVRGGQNVWIWILWVENKHNWEIEVWGGKKIWIWIYSVRNKQHWEIRVLQGICCFTGPAEWAITANIVWNNRINFKTLLLKFREQMTGGIRGLQYCCLRASVWNEAMQVNWTFIFLKATMYFHWNKSAHNVKFQCISGKFFHNCIILIFFL